MSCDSACKYLKEMGITTQAHHNVSMTSLMSSLGNDKDLCALERNVLSCFLSSRPEGKGEDCTK